MGSRMRWLTAPIALVALIVVGMPPTLADHGTRTEVKNLEAVADLPNPGTINSDMAFWGDLAFQGHWDGWQVHDISDPTNPTTILDYVDCDDPASFFAGGQGDLIVWENLLVRAWNNGASAGSFCGTDAAGDPIPISRTGFEGVHIFDITDPANPQLVGEVDIDDDAAELPDGITTGCGAHTLTAVPDPGNNRLLVYVGGSDPLCPGMDLVDIPLNNPGDAEWYGRADAGRFCHDIMVYMVNKRRAVCAGSTPGFALDDDHGYTYFSMDAADGGSLQDPVVLYERNILAVNNQDGVAITLGHTSGFSWDGKILMWSSEPAGGVGSACQEHMPPENREMYFLFAETGNLLGKWTTPTQSADENCASVHIMQSIPTTNGRDVISTGTYQAGTYIIDYTSPTNPSTIGYSDPPPEDPPILLGGAWATYWYNGYLYESDIAKGLHIHRSTSPEAQTLVKLDFMNPQTMMPLPPITPTPKCRGQEATIVGTPGDDSIVGTPGRDVIVAFGGNDTIRARGGNDLICAGPGRDIVSGGPGHDRIFGQGGNDILRGNAGNDFLHGGPGRDVCNGGPGRDRARSCEVMRNIP